MNTIIIISLIIIGLFAGLLSGIMGVGGGVVMIPLMILLLGFNQHQAQGTSLAVLAVPVTFLAAYNYQRRICNLEICRTYCCLLCCRWFFRFKNSR